MAPPLELESRLVVCVLVTLFCQAYVEANLHVLLQQNTVLVADTVVEIDRRSRRRRAVSGIAHAAEIHRRWGGEEVKEGASGGEIDFVVSRVEDLADDNPQSDKNKRDNSRELHLEVV